MKAFTKFNANLFVELDLTLIPVLCLVIFVFGWCGIGFSLIDELLLYVNDKYFKDKHILLVTAHPDDESMFFAPLLSYLTHKHHCHNTHILSLSNGGTVHRSKELRSAANQAFDIRNKHIRIIDDEESLRDDMKLYWDHDVIIQYVNEYILEHGIDIIFTFDEYGISQHPNHISIYNALQEAISDGSLHSDLDVFALKSCSVIRKYSAWFEPMLWLIAFVPLNININRSDIVILSPPNKCWHAMTHHQSQFVWFRKLFVVFSRYSWINQFHKIMPRNTTQKNSKKNQ